MGAGGAGGSGQGSLLAFPLRGWGPVEMETGVEGAREGAELGTLQEAQVFTGREAEVKAPAPRVRPGGVKRLGSHSRLDRTISQEEMDQAISQCGGRMVEAVGRVFDEVRFAAKEQIITAGDPMAHVYLIAQGEVEIYHNVSRGLDASMLGVLGQLNLPIISGLDVGELGLIQEEEEEDEQPADFLTPNQEDTGSLHGLLHGGYSQATQAGTSRSGQDSSGHGGQYFFRHSSSSGMSPATTVSGPNAQQQAQAGPSAPPQAQAGAPAQAPAQSRLVLAVKGPGDSLGLVCLEGAKGGTEAQPIWQANVRARGEVVALKAEVAGLQRLVQAHPELEAAVRKIAVQQETDLKVAEALRQLQATSLAQQQQQHRERQWEEEQERQRRRAAPAEGVEGAAEGQRAGQQDVEMMDAAAEEDAAMAPQQQQQQQHQHGSEHTEPVLPLTCFPVVRKSSDVDVSRHILA